MTNRTATTAAIILSLAAAGVPAASARPADFVPASHGSPTAAYGRQDKSMIPVSPRAASAGAIGRATALRPLAQQERQRVAALSAYREGQIAAALDVAAPPVASKTIASQAVVRVHAPQSGFDWGDAGIAGGGVALLLITVGGAFAVSGRRTRRTSALPS